MSPHEWNKKYLLNTVKDTAYVVLRSAWQCGKTTRMTEFCEQLNAAGYITCLYVCAECVCSALQKH